MEKITYPLLCFPLTDNAVLGILIGTEYQAVEPDIRRLKSTLTSHLQRQYKKTGEYPLLDIQSPALKMIEVNLRPTYRWAVGAFPLTSRVKLHTPLVYGEGDANVYECFLPLLDESFICYEINQLEKLARHFIINALDQEQPEEIYRMTRYPVPTLEFLSLRVTEDQFFTYEWNKPDTPKNLERLAERYPYPKAVQRNLTAMPDAAWELESFVADTAEKLFVERASVLIMGNNGVGKSAVLRQTFRKLAQAAKKNDLEYTFWRIQAQRFTATSKYLGEWQEKIEELVWELNTVNGILWVEDIVRLLQEGGKGVEDSVAAYLLPFIQQGRLQLAGEVTPRQLESMRRLLPGFAESMQVIHITELPEKQLNTVFEKLTAYLRQNLKVNITEDALDTAIRLLKRFNPYESFPGKGIRFLGECVNDALFHQKKQVNRQDVIAHFIRRTGLPELFLRDDLLLDQQELYSFFEKRIIGQSAVVERLANIVKIFKAGLNNPYKPITTLIFAGPTGVGKTASAQALSEYFFGKGQRQSPLIRIDMSEYQHSSQITRFLGVGLQPGKLVSDMRERPFAVVLLDEAEKATPSIFDAFLTVLDEGMLVDAFGRVTNFRNCIIILTTNLGATNQRTPGFGSQVVNDEVYRSAIGRHFRPEFINRIDDVVIFQPLSPADIREIARKELEEARKREGFLKRGLKVVFTGNVLDYLSEIGFHEKYGARPLQRALEDAVLRPLATWMLRHPEVMNTVLEVDYKGEVQVKYG